MFKILQKTMATGVVTSRYPGGPAIISEKFRGRPEFDFAKWKDARPAAEVCPTEAISVEQNNGTRTVTVDYGRCVFCGLCAGASPEGAVRITREFELASVNRGELITIAEYELRSDGTHQKLNQIRHGVSSPPPDADQTGVRLRQTIHKVLGRSLAIREVDAGSCNGCELEIIALNNPVYDLERFGIHFVASPRHADMLLVTGPVTRNMELALRKTWAAAPDPKLVVAVGACGISGGIFGRNYATLGGVDQAIPVDVYIPGCPPRPEALLYGILLAVGRLAPRNQKSAP
jgi:Ni,Fe-hydrogenase III small subunit/formate hydrogenlyase subunit 6/NADH:ubiquinone oxidoreductase subunit I